MFQKFEGDAAHSFHGVSLKMLSAVAITRTVICLETQLTGS
jgi:hypothetical protein